MTTSPDRGLDSSADLKILLRMLTFGLVAVVIAGFVAFLFTGNWAIVAVIIVPYTVIAVFQWMAAYRRAKETSQVVAGDVEPAG